MQKQKIALIIFIIVALIIIILGGVFAYQKTFKIKNSELLGLYILPSDKIENAIRYSEGAKAVLKGRNLSKVEFYQTGGGTDIYNSKEGGLLGQGVKTVNANGELWKINLPKEKRFAEICALGFDAKNNKVGRLCLQNVYDTLSETLNWRTFEDTRFGFSFKYPDNWTINKTDLPQTSVKGLAETIVLTQNNKKYYLEKSEIPPIVINVHEASDLMDKMLADKTYNLNKQTTINGLNFAEIEDSQSSYFDDYWLDFSTKTNPKYLLFENRFQELKVTINQIISTLKITN